MKYIITENRMVSLVGNMIASAEPHFNKEDAEQFAEEDDGSVMINYYYMNNGKPVLLAKYDTWRQSIRLNRRLFELIENHFGWPNGVMAVVDWFNNEFGQDATGVGY
jgi:hypothetical protein